MVTAFWVLYASLGLLTLVYGIRRVRKHTYIDTGDFLELSVYFCILWPLSVVAFVLLSIGESKAWGNLMDWVNGV